MLSRLLAVLIVAVMPTSGAAVAAGLPMDMNKTVTRILGPFRELFRLTGTTPPVGDAKPEQGWLAFPCSSFVTSSTVATTGTP
jgi:hypothetical protein